MENLVMLIADPDKIFWITKEDVNVRGDKT